MYATNTRPRASVTISGSFWNPTPGHRHRYRSAPQVRPPSGETRYQRKVGGPVGAGGFPPVRGGGGGGGPGGGGGGGGPPAGVGGGNPPRGGNPAGRRGGRARRGGDARAHGEPRRQNEPPPP